MNQIKLMLAALLALFESFHMGVASSLRWLGLVRFANLYSQFTYDNELLLKAAALVASTANGTLVVDIGTGLFDGFLVIDATAVEIDSSDESYEIILQGSSDSDFSVAANIAPLAMMTICDKASTRGAAGVIGNGTDDVAGRYVIPCRNERNGTTYRYLRVRTVVVGTIATGINYMAWLAKR